MVQKNYDFCLARCSEKNDGVGYMAVCKDRCYKGIMVPYKMVAHQAQDSEESLYRKCLADKYPNIAASDYTGCTKDIYAQRCELLMGHFAQSAEALLSKIH